MNKLIIIIALFIFTSTASQAQEKEKALGKPDRVTNAQAERRYEHDLKKSEQARTKQFEEHRKEETQAPPILTTPQTGPAPKTDAEKVRARQKASMSKHLGPRMKASKRNPSR